jgi:BirA family biotin operon repressor/biotin-[acetyl-CoA-carboxylase] ligase
MLLDDLGGEVSGEYMSRSLVVSRAAIAKHIKKLRAMGCNIQARPGGGYTLVEVPETICEELIRAYGKTILPIRVKETIKSTNIDAKQWAEDDAEHGAMVVARTQTEGRGRRQRRWQSVPGGIWSSIILKLDIAPSQVQPVTLAAAMAVSRAITENSDGAKPEIKWPNDVLVNGKKICGILTEFIGDIDELRYLIVGIGINNSFDAGLFEDDLKGRATTLKSENIIVNSSRLIANVRDNLLETVKKWSDTGSVEHIIDFYKENMAYKNEEISILGIGEEIKGVLKDIDSDGALIVQTEDGVEKIISGEISLRRA